MVDHLGAPLDGHAVSAPPLPNGLVNGKDGGYVGSAADLAEATVTARPAAIPSRPVETPQPANENKTPPAGPEWKKQMKAGDLVVYAKEQLVNDKRGLDIGARADEQVFRELERVKQILEGLPKDDPNILRSHQILSQLYSELETEANRIIAAREVRVKQFGEKYKYKMAEEVDQEYEETVEGKKVKKTKKMATGKLVDDTDRIIQNRGQLITAITVLDQQQLILSAALEQMLSNNGTKPI